MDGLKTEETSGPVKVIQTNTVPLDFWCFSKGQISYLKEKGFNITAITSPEEYFDEFQKRDMLSAYPVEMTRVITAIKGHMEKT